MTRAPTSVDPPAGYGTMNRIGFAGYVWAVAAPPAVQPNASAARMSARCRQWVMGRSCMGGCEARGRAQGECFARESEEASPYLVQGILNRYFTADAKRVIQWPVA